MPHHFTQFERLTTEYDHVYISPHFDDAALSCGGAIARHIARHQRVLVVTACSATPPAGHSFSPFAQAMHTTWNLAPDQVVAERQREDVAALDCLGADGYLLNFLDAVYRLPERYASNDALFGAVAPDDPLRAELYDALRQITQRLPMAMVYAPLGVGNHVDHQLTHDLAAELAREGVIMAFYEDFPYAAGAGAVNDRLRQLSARGRDFVPSVLDIDATLARKISAIEAYASQIGMLFGDATTMARRVHDYAEDLRPDVGTYGERLWLMQR